MLQFCNNDKSRVLLADAEATENLAEDIFGIGVTHDAAKEIERGAEFDGDQLGRLSGLNQCGGGVHRDTRGLEKRGVAGVDGSEGLSAGKMAQAGGFRHGVEKMIEALAGDAGNADGARWNGGAGEIGFVGDEEFVFAEGGWDFAGGGIENVEDEIGGIEGAFGALNAFALEGI